MSQGVIVAAALAATAIAGAAAAEPTPGQRLFQARCQSCHSADQPNNRPGGPHLVGIVGRRPASAAGYRYSPALTRLTEPWTAVRLDAFLAAPSRVAPGTSMMISVPRPEERQAIIEYLSRSGR